MEVQITPLGAGQDVGKSCIIASFCLHRVSGDENTRRVLRRTRNTRTVMFDCGLHMGYSDMRRVPNFNGLNEESSGKAPSNVADLIDVVIVSHFHLDHVGGLPFLTEKIGYNGPIIMTTPTKEIAPLLLNDLLRVSRMRGQSGEDASETQLYSNEDIHACMKKVKTVAIGETVHVGGLSITACYAGHVLGAAMFIVRDAISRAAVMYTGDYNMQADRHMGAARVEMSSLLDPPETGASGWVPRVDALITESTYANTIRSARTVREQEFFSLVFQCVSAGGKVLIPVFALGRAQEMCLLIDDFWERMGLSYPVFFSPGLTATVIGIYKRFIGWTNANIQAAYRTRNPFEFRHIRELSSEWRTDVQRPGGMVVFATPGMLHTGMSLEVFKLWGQDPRNLVILPGYCVRGTVGNRIQSARNGDVVEIDSRTSLVLRAKVVSISFSAHTDALGIMALIGRVKPLHIILVHGDSQRISKMEKRLQGLSLSCFSPRNGERVLIPSSSRVSVQIERSIPRHFTGILGDNRIVGDRSGTHLGSLEICTEIQSSVDPAEVRRAVADVLGESLSSNSVWARVVRGKIELGWKQDDQNLADLTIAKIRHLKAGKSR